MTNSESLVCHYFSTKLSDIAIGWHAADEKAGVTFIKSCKIPEPFTQSGIPERFEPVVKYIFSLLNFEREPLNAPVHLLNFNKCTSFQRKVLAYVQTIPYGNTSTYALVGKAINCNGGARAIGNALASNPFPFIIPCHRVIKSDGSLGGYQGGKDLKRKIIEGEKWVLLKG
jgi:methylated-DNA-[protein]-cysteine S-methyltransferase